MKTKPYWIVDEYLLDISERKDEIISFLDKYCEYVIAPFSRFHNLDLPNEVIDGVTKCGISYGSVQFASKCTREANLYPMSYYDETFFHVMHYTSKYDPSYFLNSDGFFVTYSWLCKNLSYYQSILGNKIFVRPNSPKKLFTGLVIENEEDLNILFKTSSVVGTTLLFISSAKHLSKEIRYFIVDGKVVAHSQYHSDHEIFISEDDNLECRELAQKMADDTDAFNNTFVCDVGLHNGVPKVVELNCINTSGWYLANVYDIMSALNTKIMNEFSNYE